MKIDAKCIGLVSDEPAAYLACTVNQHAIDVPSSLLLLSVLYLSLFEGRSSLPPQGRPNI